MQQPKCILFDSRKTIGPSLEIIDGPKRKMSAKRGPNCPGFNNFQARPGQTIDPLIDRPLCDPPARRGFSFSRGKMPFLLLLQLAIGNLRPKRWTTIMRLVHLLLGPDPGPLPHYDNSAAILEMPQGPQQLEMEMEMGGPQEAGENRGNYGYGWP